MKPTTALIISESAVLRSLTYANRRIIANYLRQGRRFNRFDTRVKHREFAWRNGLAQSESLGMDIESLVRAYIREFQSRWVDGESFLTRPAEGWDLVRPDCLKPPGGLGPSQNEAPK